MVRGRTSYLQSSRPCSHQCQNPLLLPVCTSLCCRQLSTQYLFCSLCKHPWSSSPQYPLALLPLDYPSQTGQCSLLPVNTYLSRCPIQRIHLEVTLTVQSLYYPRPQHPYSPRVLFRCTSAINTLYTQHFLPEYPEVLGSLVPLFQSLNTDLPDSLPLRSDCTSGNHF